MHLSSETVRSNTVRRPHLRVVPLAQIDKRTRFGRRVSELASDFTEALGGRVGVSRVLATKIADAAQLKAIAEQVRADYLGGNKVTLGHLIRVERRADNAVNALGIVEPEKPTGVKAYLGAKQQVAAG
jgi:hypothetical protein